MLAVKRRRAVYRSCVIYHAYEVEPMPEWLQRILAEPTTSVPDAGRALGISRNAAYQAAAEGQIKTVRLGRTLRVPTAWLKSTLQLTERDAA
jgi:hypothetical protein